MKAVIMAGGEGTRLRPLTSRQPKPMLPVANRPMMEHVVNLLKAHDIDEIVVTVAFLAGIIQNHFGDGSEYGVRMVYATEESPLGTAGSVRNAMAELTEPFVVISGDVLTDIDLSAVIDAHKHNGSIATIALKSMENPLDFGIVIQNEDKSIERFLEKPTWGQVFSDTVNTGIYVLEPAIFDHIPPGTASDFSADVFPRLLSQGKPVFGFVVEGYWEDVGTLEAYLRAHYDVLDGKVAIDIPGFRLDHSVWLGEGAEVSPEARIDGPAIIGPYTTVAANAWLGEYAILGANVRVGEAADIRRSIVHDNSYIGPHASIRGTVLSRSVDLRQGARCEEGVVIGDDTFVGDHAVISSGVKIYPNKEVEQGAVVNSSIVWEQKAARNLFGRLGVSGLANVDITPELAVRVAMAFGSTLKKGSTVTVSRDSSRAARAIMRAAVAGLNASGVSVLDLEVSPVPVTRFLVRSGRSRAGLSVRLHPADPDWVMMRFFDENGHDIDETMQRKVERLFVREDVRRVAASEIGDIGYPARAIEYYTAALVEQPPLKAIRDANFKIVLDYAYGSTSFVMPNVLSKLNAEVLTINPFGSTRAMIAFDRQEHAAQVASFVQASGAHLGLVFDPDGESVMLIDDTGHLLTDEEARLVVLALVGRTLLTRGQPVGSRIAIPVSAPIAAERIAAQYGLDIAWSKLSMSALMERSAEPGVIVGASSDGGFIFPNFLPAYDAASTFVNVIGMLAESCTTLSGLLAELPKAYVVHEAVATPWEQKGLVMRSLVESVRERDEVMLIDGVKVRDGNTWALVAPDPERALTHVWAEGQSSREARGIVQQYVRQIRQTLRLG